MQVKKLWMGLWCPIVICSDLLRMVVGLVNSIVTAIHSMLMYISGWDTWVRRRTKLADERYFGVDDDMRWPREAPSNKTGDLS